MLSWSTAEQLGGGDSRYGNSQAEEKPSLSVMAVEPKVRK
jgi:hypothetical protein